MVLYVPFGDNQVHGALDKYLIFARRRGKVYAKKYQAPKNPNTADQQTQRLLFKDAVTAWQSLSEPDKNIWRAKASGLSATGYNLFIRDYLLNPPVPGVPLLIKKITGMVIDTPRSTVAHGWRMALFWQYSGNFFYVWDNGQDIFDRGTIPSAQPIKFQALGGSQPINILAGDSCTVTHDQAPSPITIYLPRLTSGNQLFVGDDGSTYWDSDYLDLAQAPP